MAKSIVLLWLSFFLGLFFIFIGSMKITPNINRDMHREIVSDTFHAQGSVIFEVQNRISVQSRRAFRENSDALLGIAFASLERRMFKSRNYFQRRNFISYAKVFPWNLLFSVKLSAKVLRYIVGWTEVCCGTTLLLIPGEFEDGNLFLTTGE